MYFSADSEFHATTLLQRNQITVDTMNLNAIFLMPLENAMFSVSKTIHEEKKI
jgi:hypothetical protein